MRKGQSVAESAPFSGYAAKTQIFFHPAALLTGPRPRGTGARCWRPPPCPTGQFKLISAGATANGWLFKQGGALALMTPMSNACPQWSPLHRLPVDLVQGPGHRAQLLVQLAPVDVVEGYLHQGDFYEDEAHAVPIQGERGKIYVDLTTNLSYRYGGSAYVVITSSDMVEVSNSELQSLWDAAALVWRSRASLSAMVPITPPPR